MTAPAPQARLGTLPRADGSATYAHGGYTVTASANGPIEAQRRDENPDEANVDVIVRPAAGVGGPSERNLEAILQQTLHDLVLVQEFPRCAIQVVLQVQTAPENDYANTKLNQAGLNLPVLPALLQAAVLALLAANIPMRTIATATALAIMPHPAGTQSKTPAFVAHPTPRDVAAALSLHVFAFSGQDDELLLAESEGAFTMAEWDAARAAAWTTCCRAADADADADGSMALDDETAAPSLRDFVRATVVQRVEDVLQWKLQT